jgi:hypothetical protein
MAHLLLKVLSSGYSNFNWYSFGEEGQNCLPSQDSQVSNILVFGINFNEKRLNLG